MNVNLATIRHQRRQIVWIQTFMKQISKRELTLRNDNYLRRHEESKELILN